MAVRTVCASENSSPKPNGSLVIYHFMFGRRQTKACPMCTGWLDGANGVDRSSADYRKNPTSKQAADVPFDAMRLQFFPTNLFTWKGRIAM
jgi:hypothetical protein